MVAQSCDRARLSSLVVHRKLIMTNDFSIRTSQNYDDRRGDVLTTLTKPGFVCDEGTLPVVITFINVGSKTNDNDNDRLCLNLELTKFVNLKLLPANLRNLVEEHIK